MLLPRLSKLPHQCNPHGQGNLDDISRDRDVQNYEVQPKLWKRPLHLAALFTASVNPAYQYQQQQSKLSLQKVKFHMKHNIIQYRK